MAESSESPGASPAVIKIAAPLLFGPLFNWALYGVLCIQIYVYSYNFPDDRRSVKFIAYFVFVVETVQTALTGADIFYWFVAGFGDVARLGNSHFAAIDIPIITAVTSLIVQGYFCYRIWVLNKRTTWICWIIAVCAVTQAVASTWLGITSLRAGKYVLSKAALYVWSIPGATADILIAVAMMLLLRRARGNLSNLVLIRVVRVTIETNALTATLAITVLVLYAAFPNELYYVYITEMIGKVYSNTLLVSLNNRIYFRDYQASELSDSGCVTFSESVRGIAVRSPRSAVPESQPQVSKSGVIPLYTVSRLGDLDNIKSDDTDTTHTSLYATP